MARDEISSMTGFYYQQNNNGSGGSLTNALLSTLLSAISGSPAGASVHGQAGAITSQLSSNVDFASFVSSSNTSTGQPPKAYLTILFFDERFQFLAAESRQEQVDPGRNGTSPLPLLNIRAPKNGYAYVYVSNESNEPVYFDNFVVQQRHSNIIEENHYYAYGLKIAAISSQKANSGLEETLGNKYLYQGDYSEFDEEIGWNDFELRSYDPQIGRWVQHDPYDQFASPYIGMGNDPVNNIDEDGGFSAGAIGTLTGTVAGFTAGFAITRHNGGSIIESLGAGIGGAFIGAGIGYGIGASLSGGGSFLNETKAFYKGLFSPGSAGEIIRENGGFSKCFSFAKETAAEIPDIWGSIGKILPNISLPKLPLKIGVYSVDIWVTVMTRIIDPKDFVDNPHEGSNAYPDPSYGNGNVYRFDYDANPDPDDQNNRTRIRITPFNGKMRKLNNGSSGIITEIRERNYNPACGTDGNSIYSMYFQNAYGYPAGNAPLIPNSKYRVKKEKLESKKGIYIKMFKGKFFCPGSCPHEPEWLCSVLLLI